MKAVIERWPVHDAAYAYCAGRGIRQNASVHSTGAFLLRMDFKNFFPSLLRRHVGEYLESRSPGLGKWSASDREFFLSVVCKGDALTIGAPTSPSLSNALCFELDSRLTALATDRGARYSRYADDLFFSTARPGLLGTMAGYVRRAVAELPFPNGLTLNEDKTHHTSRRWRREVTGLILTPQGELSLGRNRKRFIRGLVHRYEKLTGEERSSLRGLLSFARSIEPDLINRLVLKYGPERVKSALGGE